MNPGGERTFYICVGAQRSATTWIYRSLDKLSEIKVPCEKELDFFRRLGNYYRGMSWYLDQFEGATIQLDITPEYAVFPESIELIHENLGANAKILFILRDPVDRLVSAYQKHMRNGELVCDFDFFVKYNIDHCVDRSLYFPVIKRIEKYYKPTVLVYEDIKKNPAIWLDGINGFFDVKIAPSQSKSKFNPSAGLGGFRGVLNRIYRVMPAWLGLRRLKEWIESTSVGNKLLYNNDNKEVNYYEQVLSNQALIRMFNDDCEKVSAYLGRDLRAVWKSCMPTGKEI